MHYWGILSNINWIQAVWIAITIGIALMGLVVLLAPYWPFLNDLVKYGKSQSSQRSAFHHSIEVPKKWFTHFYFWFTFVILITAFFVVSCYFYNNIPPTPLRNVIIKLAAPNKNANVNELGVLLAVIALCIHSVRRLHESLYVSVYSSTKMNILHYALGFLHYGLLPLTIMSEAPGFVTLLRKNIEWRDLSVFQVVGLVLFVVSSYYQHECLNILANMRRNYLGNITTYAHGIPVTSWFDYVSCPHFLCEILIYVALYLMLNLSHRSWLLVVFFVATNQVIAALITHNWYREKFKSMYPVNRKALIPWLI